MPTRPPPDGKAGRKRVPRDERRSSIVAAATQLFAEKGLNADMRELARRLGITHPALFRHFSSKEVLIEEVYRCTFLDNWRPEWETIITNRNLSLSNRLSAFYSDFAELALSFIWVRLYMFAALEGLHIHKEVYRRIEERIIRPLCSEIRESYGLPDIKIVPLKELEVELVWSFHSRIFYFGVRKHVYGMNLPADMVAMIEAEADTMTMGLGPYICRLLT